MKRMIRRVCIDAGHGGKDPGAVGPTGLRESDVNLAIARNLQYMLIDEGIMAVDTRQGDVYVTLSERANLANEWDVDLGISIHCNAVGNPVPNGYEVYTSPGQTKADVFATIWFNRAKAAFPRALGRADWQDGDPDREKHLYMTDRTNMPFVLIETGFISHPETEALMRTDVWIRQMAATAYEAVLAYRDGLDA